MGYLTKPREFHFRFWYLRNGRVKSRHIGNDELIQNAQNFVDTHGVTGICGYVPRYVFAAADLTSVIEGNEDGYDPIVLFDSPHNYIVTVTPCPGDMRMGNAEPEMRDAAALLREGWTEIPGVTMHHRLTFIKVVQKV
jgi:hypothetical protein